MLGVAAGEIPPNSGICSFISFPTVTLRVHSLLLLGWGFGDVGGPPLCHPHGCSWGWGGGLVSGLGCCQCGAIGGIYYCLFFCSTVTNRLVSYLQLLE